MMPMEWMRVTTEKTQISLPVSGDRQSVSLDTGSDAMINIAPQEIEGVALGDHGALIIALKNGGQIIVKNFEEFTNAGQFIYLKDNQLLDFGALLAPPSQADLSLKDTNNICEFNPNESFLIQNDGDVVLRLADGQEVQIAEGNEAMTLDDGMKVDAKELLTQTTKVDDLSAQKAAKLAPAAGDEEALAKIAQEVAALDPEAGDGAAGASNSGYGFNSSFSLTPFNAPPAIGPLGPTQLAYNAPQFINEQFIPLNPDGTPSLLLPSGAVEETNFKNGNLTQSGKIDVNFGSDGAGRISGNNIFKASGALPENILSSGGFPITVRFDAQTNSYIGVISNAAGAEANNVAAFSNSGDGFAEPQAFAAFSAPFHHFEKSYQPFEETVVFRLEIDPRTGEYLYTQFEPIDHGNTLDDNEAIDLDFGIRVTDRDGDSANGTLRITVFDDGPTIGDITKIVDESDIYGSNPVVTQGQVPHDFGGDEAGVIRPSGIFQFIEVVGQPPQQLTSGGHPVHVTTTADGYIGRVGHQTIFTLTIDPQTGRFTYKQFKGIDHPDKNDPDDVVWLKFYVDIIDGDGDREQGVIVIDVKDDGPTFGDTVKVLDETNIGVNSPAVIEGHLPAGYNNGSTHPNGQFLVLFQEGGANQTLTSNGHPVHVSKTATGYVGKVGHETIFTLTIDPVKGTFVYKQFAGVDHPDTHNPDDVIWLKFGVDVMDYDGDRAHGFIQVDIRDDGPVINNSGTARAANESELEHGAVITIQNKLHVDYGADSKGGTLKPNGEFQTLFKEGGPNQILTSSGQVVHVTQTTSGYIGKAGHETIFTLTIQNDGSYTYKQFGAIDHPAEGKTGTDDVIWLKFGVTATDGDGDKTKSQILIDIRDDGPQARGDQGYVSQSQRTISGNVLQNDDFGADGKGALITIGTYHGRFGTLTLHQDGTYSYTRTGDAGGTDQFSYVIRDADGDRSTAHFTIHIEDVPPPPPPPPPPEDDDRGDGDGGDGCPLVIDLDGDGIELRTKQDGVMFDIDEDGIADRTAWVHADDGILVRDINQDGVINDHSEMFGNDEIGGFEMLAQYDDNHDGVIDAQDAIWSTLKIWQDRNGDAYSQSDEFITFDQLKIESINLTTIAFNQVVAGNNVTVKGQFNAANGQTFDGYDAWFKYDSSKKIAEHEDTVSLKGQFEEARATDIINGNGTFKIDGYGDGDYLTHNGQAIHVVYDSHTNIYFGSTQEDLIFNLKIEEDGAYQFNMFAAIDHAQNSDLFNNIVLHFGIIVSDDNGAERASDITISISGLMNEFSSSVQSPIAFSSLLEGQDDVHAALEELAGNNQDTIIGEAAQRQTHHDIFNAQSVLTDTQYRDDVI